MKNGGAPVLISLAWLLCLTAATMPARVAAQTPPSQADAPPIVAPPDGKQPGQAQNSKPDHSRPNQSQTVTDSGIDTAAPMAAMPDMGVDWPDMAQPDKVVPLAEDKLAEDKAPQQTDGTPSIGAPIGAPPATEAAAQTSEQPPTPETTPAAEARADATVDHRYAVALNGVDDIEDTLFRQRFDELSALKQGDGKAANIAQINRRAREDEALIERLMRAKGYYDVQIVHSIAPETAGSSRLQVRFDVVPGPEYLLTSVDVTGLQSTGAHEPALRAAFPVKVGDPVDADKIVAGQTSLAVKLGEEGFPFAKVDDPEVTIDHDTRDGQLAMLVTPGGYRLFGDIIVPDRRLFSARHVQRIARFRPGDQFMASDIEDLRRALIATGLVSSVTLTPKDAGDDTHVNVQADLTPAPPRTIAGALGYGTGEGFRAEASWQHRNFFPPEGAITLRGVAGTQEQSGSITFRRNNFRKRDQVLNAQISAGNIHRAAYDARTVGISGSFERQSNLIFQKKWTWSVGGELLASDEQDSSGPLGATQRRTYFIAALPAMLTYDGSDNLLDPHKGFRLGGRISPELSFQDGTFGYARAQIDGSFYIPAGEKVVIAGRTRLGTIIGSSATRIAPSRRFYAGGGGSVRGYGYQQIGPRDINNDPVGGKSLAEFSLEARVRVGSFGVVPFVDAGNISATGLPKFDNLRVGAGLGLRYYTNFGPIRIDVGTPINPAKGDPRVAVYVSLGQAF